jgi:hypothetical protein
MGLWIDKRIFTPQEARLQAIADGLVDISVPEKIDEKAFDILPVPTAGGFGGDTANKRPGMLGKPVPPSSGGHGEVKNMVLEEALKIPEFKSIYDELDQSWDNMSMEDQDKAVAAVDSFLGEIMSEQDVIIDE